MRAKASHSSGQIRQTLRHPKKYVSLKVAARRAGLSVTTMYQWAKKGQTSSGTPIQVVKDDLRNQLLISEDSLIALLANRYTLLQPLHKTGSSQILVEPMAGHGPAPH